MQLPTFDSYGTYSSDNYGAHTMRFHFGPVTVWYSYKTVVAFRVDGGPYRVLDYTDSKTTFKHLNMIDGGNKAGRLSATEFQKLWDKEVGPRVKA